MQSFANEIFNLLTKIAHANIRLKATIQAAEIQQEIFKFIFNFCLFSMKIAYQNFNRSCVIVNICYDYKVTIKQMD